jgi:hypothetical protein
VELDGLQCQEVVVKALAGAHSADTDGFAVVVALAEAVWGAVALLIDPAVAFEFLAGFIPYFIKCEIFLRHRCLR